MSLAVRLSGLRRVAWRLDSGGAGAGVVASWAKRCGLITDGGGTIDVITRWERSLGSIRVSPGPWIGVTPNVARDNAVLTGILQFDGGKAASAIYRRVLAIIMEAQAEGARILPGAARLATNYVGS